MWRRARDQQPKPEDDPNYVGPPPRRPDPPTDEQPAHVLHLLLTLLTAGFWVIVWILLGLNANANNRVNRARYADDVAEWQVRYDKWQRRYHDVYGTPPPSAV